MVWHFALEVGTVYLRFGPKRTFGLNDIRSVCTIEYVNTKKTDVLLNMQSVTVGQKETPPKEELEILNSLTVWGKVTEALKRKDYKVADEHKDFVENRQRKLAAERLAKGDSFKHQLFRIDSNGNWIFNKYNGTPYSPTTETWIDYEDFPVELSKDIDKTKNKHKKNKWSWSGKFTGTKQDENGEINTKQDF